MLNASPACVEMSCTKLNLSSQTLVRRNEPVVCLASPHIKAYNADRDDRALENTCAYSMFTCPISPSLQKSRGSDSVRSGCSYMATSSKLQADEMLQHEEARAQRLQDLQKKYRRAIAKLRVSRIRMLHLRAEFQIARPKVVWRSSRKH